MSARRAPGAGPSGGGRAAGLLAVAVVLGIVLLNATDNPRTPVAQAAAKVKHSEKSVTTLPPVTTTTPLRAPSEVKVLTANGTKVNGVGARAAAQLKSAGYDVLAPADAPPTAKSSTVYFTPGYDREAAAVAALLGIPPTGLLPEPTPAPVSDTRGANVIVIVGPDLVAKLAPATPSSTTAKPTTTTAKPTATTAKPATTTTTKKP